MKFCYRLLILLVLLSSSLLAQPYKTRSLGLQEGLPEYYVSGLIQDNAGFVWIATRNGLARYDGRKFKVFRHRHSSQTSLANNVIRSMRSVSETTMLIQLENGTLQVFNPATEHFNTIISTKQLEQTHVKTDNPILTVNERIVWGWNTSQIYRYDIQKKRVKTYPIPSLPESSANRESAIVPDQHQQLNVPLPGRLVQFDTCLGKFRSWAHPMIGLPGKIETYYGTSLLRRASGEILIGAAQKLVVFNPNTHRFRTISIPSSINTQVGLIYEATNGQVYFTCGMTVYRLAHNDHVIPIWTAPRIDYQNYFHALLVDRSGVLWIGTNGDGVQQIDLQALPIKTYPYKTNFVQDVLSAELQLAVPNWLKVNNHIYQLRLAGSAPYISVGIGSWFDLLRADTKTRTLRSILRRKQRSPYTEIKGGNALAQSNGIIWIYEPHQGLLKADSTGQLLDKFEWKIPINWVTSIQPMSQTVWIGSEESGLYAYDLGSRRIVQHLRYKAFPANTLPSDHVQCLVADPTNPAILWIGTDEGLSQLDTRTMRFQNWSEDQGLPSGTINTLLLDRKGDLWFSTGKGISRMNPQTKKTRHFSTNDGIMDIEYRPNHALQLPNGRMAFGGATGITVFDPLALTDSAQSIATVLTGFRLGNVPVEHGKNGSPLSLPLNATQVIRLKHNENFFGIEFAGMQYNKPASLRYRYQLKGVNADWINAGNQTLANYTQVRPGNYEFNVNTADADGRWSSLIKTIRISIEPPWWGTWWFYFLATFACLTFIYGLYRYRLAQVLKLHNLRNDIARDLHDDVGSSISSIAIYSNIMLGQLGNSTFKSGPLLVKITEQANEIMGSMNDIVWSINTKNDAFDEVFIRMREYAVQFLETKGYMLHFDFDENLHRTKLDMEKRRDFYLIYKEVLNNIAKYANGNNVWISVQQRNSVIELLIRDDGLGFEVNAVRSSGNGLTNMNYRAASLKGTLRIVSEPGAGTTIHLTF
ncbi:ligand-binding sensor domain-containing protein [Dyadobacter bucti]|uniref:ligand-binding sensor domain-containing protein n=1 Tax=Dyadobacter bucti TaxID=2572203 RepID=UPI003F715EF9